MLSEAAPGNIHGIKAAGDVSATFAFAIACRVLGLARTSARRCRRSNAFLIMTGIETLRCACKKALRERQGGDRGIPVHPSGGGRRFNYAGLGRRQVQQPPRPQIRAEGRRARLVQPSASRAATKAGVNLVVQP